jgi:type II secretory pathway pseudopilin PulG
MYHGITGKRAKSELGMTMIELLIAISVLFVGMAAMMILFTIAIATNGRSKTDTTGTMLAQEVMEQISAAPANTNPTITMTDCNPSGTTTWSIATTGSASPGSGASVVTSTGSIDWTQAYSAVTANYKMQYVACGASGQQATYDVRWNVMTVAANITKLITVSARQIAAGASTGRNRAVLFATPITLRTITGL